ncbi:MAG: YgcG family protein [Leptospiraceae bacterium]|nr:YgcG family protein [Leptospiraceae bacterium]
MQKTLSSKSSRVRILLFIVSLFISHQVFAEVSIPELNGRVNDLSGILESIQREALEDKLKTIENNKGSQVAILIIPTTEEETIDQFSIRVVEKWKLGRKEVNDGVLILIATDDRKMRIEVGYGLEGILPDAICRRIISEQMKPHFKEKNYYEGIDNAVESISKIINGETLPPPKKKETASSNNSNIMDTFFTCLFLVVFGSAIVSGFASGFLGRLIGSGIFASIGTAIILSSVSSFGFILGFIAFLIMIVLIFFISKSRSSGYGGGSSWSSSSSDSSWSSSSSDSFSGGGGSFGGGGSSGDW